MIHITPDGIIMHRTKPIGYIDAYRVYINGRDCGEYSDRAELFALIRKELGI